MVPVVDGIRFVEVRVTVAVYVVPVCIPVEVKTEKYKAVCVVNVPLTVSQLGPGAFAYTVAVENVIGVLESAVPATETAVDPLPS
jgi:hypothetical protein